MQQEIILKKLSFDLVLPSVCVCVVVVVVGGGSAGKIYGSMLLNFVILFNLICKMTML